MKLYLAADDRLSIGEHGKEETLTGQDGMREIDEFLIDTVGSETEDIGGKTCANDDEYGT